MPEAVVAGTGETRFVRRAEPGTETCDLFAEAAREALEEAGLALSDVDGLAVGSFSLKPDHVIDLAWRLGVSARWLLEDTNGGAGGVNMLQMARRAVEVGDASTVLVLGGGVLSPGDFADLVANYNRVTRDYLAPLDYGGPNALFSLLTQRHMERHGLGREDYGAVAIAQRAWAAGNPRAVYRQPLTMEEYLDAPMVADPLCRYDCVPVASGASALVVTRADRVTRGVRVRAFVASYNEDHQDGDGLTTGLRRLAPSLWEQASLGPADVDVIGVYDDYPVMVLVQLADLGFAAGDDIPKMVREDLASRRLPVNTSGGQLSAGQVSGSLQLVLEVVRQLRGDAGERQVANARTGVVSGYGMALYRYCACVNAVVLEGPL